MQLTRVCLFSFLMLQSALGASNDIALEAGHQVELLREDLFAAAPWTASDIQIAGIGLGQSRPAAISMAQSMGFTLVEYGESDKWIPCSASEKCILLTGVQPSYTGVELRFDRSNSIAEIAVEVDPDLRSSISHRFKGLFRGFCGSDYSDGLRIKLFGKESKVESLDGRWGLKIPDSKYFYPRLGVSLTVSATVGQARSSGRRRQTVRTISFVVPGGQ